MSLPTFSILARGSTGLLLTAVALQFFTPIALSQSALRGARKETCPLTKSIYQAISQPEFELVFGPSKSGIASEVATFTLKHKTRGNIVSYNLGGSMGYGGLYLTAAEQKNRNDSDEKLKPYFFDSTWKNIRGMTNPVPRYLFIAGLGVEDWYSNRPGNRAQPLGDVMWQFNRCQSR